MITGSAQLLLLKILCVSSVGKPISELADELEVNAKTIRRDLAAFHDVGFPIEESTGPAGRKSYRIVNGSHLPELSFTYDEALALYLGRQYLEPLAGTFRGTLLRTPFARSRRRSAPPC